MKRALVSLLPVSAIVIVIYIIKVYHIGQYPSPVLLPALTGVPSAKFYAQKDYGIHHVFLFGRPYQRGKDFGRLTASLLQKQESELHEQLKSILPYKLVRKVFFLALMRWYHGLEDYIDNYMVAEMKGVSEATSDKFDFLADKLTRQVAYHGLHEVGQLMVDSEFNFGCTVFSIPFRNSYVIGRNFDFEAGRIFDEQKILKWTFPEKGLAYASLTWAGMVGVVSGVNKKGVYISLNASGTNDIARLGTPTTLIAQKVLQFAQNAKEALEIIRESRQIISEIYVVASPDSPVVYRIEKSAHHTKVIPLSDFEVVTNHMHDPSWKRDSVNSWRMKNLTTVPREKRGLELLRVLKTRPIQSSGELNKIVLQLLRDKKGVGNQSLALGNRLSIDPLIATHSLIYNMKDQTLFVSTGPATVGHYEGIDLTASFKEQRPIRIEKLLQDSDVSKSDFNNLKESLESFNFWISQTEIADCSNPPMAWNPNEPHYKYFMARAEWGKKCKRDNKFVRQMYQKALGASPSYLRTKSEIEKGLKSL